MHTEIIQAIEQMFTIVTPTRRLARALQQQYANMQLEAGHQLWETPTILPWTAYIKQLWEDLSAQQKSSTVLLNTQQQQSIWRQIISRSSYTENFLQTSTIASQSYVALKYTQQWQLRNLPADLWLNQDALAFSSWYKAYQQSCTEHGWVDITSLEATLIDIQSQQAHQYKQRICLFGFDELIPAQRSLLQALEKAGSEIKDIQPLSSHHSGDISRFEFTDQIEEIKAVAHWIRDQLQADQTLSIGIVVPELQAIRSDIENIFADVLIPSNILSVDEHQLDQRPYNISLGEPLASYPIIQAAFSIFALHQPPIELHQLATLLHSPWIKGAETEMIARAQLHTHLRRQGSPINSIAELQWLVTDPDWSKLCPQFISLLQGWDRSDHLAPKTRSAWAIYFSRLLETSAWPGERDLQSAEFQTIVAWQKLLAQFATLDLVAGPINYSEAYLLLRGLAAEYIHQASSAEVPVQIMGIIEASGLRFDRLWIMGLHDKAWPAVTHATPFIPIKLQRQKKIPHSSPERELEYARTITHRLTKSADQIILSSPRSIQGRAVRPSPLLEKWTITDIEQRSNIDYIADIFHSRDIQRIPDGQAPAVDESQISGGADLFRDQAACPFRAFAKHRLAARSLIKSEVGINMMQRGQLVHACLQIFWQRTKTSQRLCELSDNILRREIQQCVDIVLKNFQPQHSRTAGARLISIERDRLCGLIWQWLSIEKDRPVFTVLATEQAQQHKIGNLQLKVRIDRIDQLPGGHLVIIDYKTGHAELSDWMDQRPVEPQLPLYAISSSGNVAAIAFAIIKSGEMKMLGLAEDSDAELPSGIKPLSKLTRDKYPADWATLIEQWQSILTRLADSHELGDARVDPARANTCDYCDLANLCRIDPTSVTRGRRPVTDG